MLEIRKNKYSADKQVFFYNPYGDLENRSILLRDKEKDFSYSIIFNEPEYINGYINDIRYQAFRDNKNIWHFFIEGNEIAKVEQEEIEKISWTELIVTLKARPALTTWIE